MKTRRIFLIIALISSVLATVGYAQTTYTWTNAAGGDIAVAANWNPNGVPNPVSGPGTDTNGNSFYGDELLWDGQTTTDLALTANTGQTAFSSGTPAGLRVHLTPNQTNAVNIHPPANISVTAGTRLNGISLDAGSGQFSFGDNTTNGLDLLFGASNPATHEFLNNSSYPAVIRQNVRHRLGAGGAHTFIFDGPGDWIVSNYWANANGAATVVTKAGTGTMTWYGMYATLAVQPTTVLATPLGIDGGTLILKSHDLVTSQTINNIGTNGVPSLLVYDASDAPGAFTGTINGIGNLQVKSGQLTLSGNNSYTGTNILSGGRLVLNRAETAGASGPLGFGGDITFAGGTLVFSSANAYDYSPRFDTNAGQQYRFDTGGGSVLFATGLSSPGGTLTLTNSGTLTLGGSNTYDGLTTVLGGTLVLQGAKLGTGSITVVDGATLGVTEGATQATPATLTMGTSAGANLAFNNVTNTTTAPIAAGTVSNAGTITISINSGRFLAIGQTFPLLTWSTGPAPAVALGVVSGAAGTLYTNNNMIGLTITATPYVWTGANGSWDTTTAGNWTQQGTSKVWRNGSIALFDDTATGTTSLTVGSSILASDVTVNTSVLNYSIASSGANNISGSHGLSKGGSSVLTLSGGANSYTGPTTITGGTVSVSALANGGLSSDLGASSSNAANLVFNGGAMQYLNGGAASIDRLFSVGTGGGTIDASGNGALVLANTAAMGPPGSGPRALNLIGATVDTNTLAAMIADGFAGSTSLGKNGSGTWILTGTNTYTGSTTVSQGILQVGAGSTNGTLGTGPIANSGTLDFNRAGSLTVSGIISGSGSVINDGPGTVILANNNNYTGGTTINNGTLQVGNGGATGSLNQNRAIVDNGTLIFNTSGTFSYNGGGLISGTGNVIVRGGGTIRAYDANSYTGWTQIDANSTFLPCEGNTGALASSVVTNNGKLKLVTQDAHFSYASNILGTGQVLIGANNFNGGTITLLGSNTYTGGTLIGSDTLTLGDGATAGAGWTVGNVSFVNNFDTTDDNARILAFNLAFDYTFAGNIVTNFTSAQNNRGIVQKDGVNTLTLTGANTYAGGTTINAGTLQIGAGGASGTIGFGPVTDNGVLILNRAGNLTVGGVISGAGSVYQIGAGTSTLTNTNTYSGPTVISNGTLAVTAVGLSSSEVDVCGGALQLGALGTITNMSLAGPLNITNGTVVVSVNKSLSPASNTLITVGGVISAYGGTLKLLNFGPALAPGDKFVVFSQPVTGGAKMTVYSPGVTLSNNLAGDGSVSVVTVQPPASIGLAFSAGQLSLSWPSNYTGLHMQVQTNTLKVGLSNNWVTIPGSDATNVYTNKITLTNGAIFYRLSE